MREKRIVKLIKIVLLSTLMVFITACGGGSSNESEKEASVNDVGALVVTPVTAEDLEIRSCISN